MFFLLALFATSIIVWVIFAISIIVLAALCERVYRWAAVKGIDNKRKRRKRRNLKK